VLAAKKKRAVASSAGAHYDIGNFHNRLIYARQLIDLVNKSRILPLIDKGDGPISGS
jgi:hypothetical protein